MYDMSRVQPEHPAVSVIIPVYGVEAWLPACLDSVLGQTLKEIELLCIDDASPDGCGRILDSYAARDPRIRVFHLEENRMQGCGRNLGLAHARGDYVYFLDSDDLITPEALEALYEAARREDLDGIAFDSCSVYDSPELEKKFSFYPAALQGDCPEGVCTGRELLNLLSLRDQWSCLIQRQFWKRSFLTEQDLRFPEQTEHEDESFSLRAFLLARRMKYLKQAYFLHRFRAGSVMTRKTLPRDLHGYLTVWADLTEFVWEQHLEEEPGVRIQLGRLYDRMQRSLPVFRAQADPGAWFREEKYLRLYRYFVSSEEAKAYQVNAAAAAASRLDPEHDRIRIYGAGIMGRRCLEGFAALGFEIAGFLVSSREGNPRVLCGLPVQTPEEVYGSPGSRKTGQILRENAAGRRGSETVVIAMAKGLQPEIHRILDTYGAAWIDY